MTVDGGGYRFEYRVDERWDVVRGMGYNPRLAGLPLGERRQALARDFELMRRHGVNTLVGWDPAEFDAPTLDVAAEAGLGVVLPFDFDFRADYRDGAVRSAVTDQVLAWVDHYRRHPSLRMWGLGNEVLQRSVPPTWCAEPPTADAAERARAFSSLLVELADRVHALDPDHPVLYRDAEDAYASWIAEALRAVPTPRPWFVYGINAYTPRLAEILDEWPRHGIDTAVLVSEYALLGAERGARAQPLRDLWSLIRDRPEYVVGGAVYVWYAEGPEEVDRHFGLVDADAQPVDDALAVIGELYRADEAGR